MTFGGNEFDVIAIDRHRNGIEGAPFYVVLFREGDSRKLGIVFDEAYYCAVLDVERLARGDVAFGSNSWRGDAYEPYLRAVIESHFQWAGGKGG